MQFKRNKLPKPPNSMPVTTEPLISIDKIYAFNHTWKEIWSSNEPVPEGSTAAIVLIDMSLSMTRHKKALAMAVACILEDTNVDKNFAVPEPDGSTAMVQAIDEIMRDDGGNVGKTVYLVGDGGENMKVGTLQIGRDGEQNIVQSLPLDFTVVDDHEEQETARHYRALVDFLKFKRITLVMLALGDTVKGLLKGLASTKDVYLAHLDCDEDIDNMMKIANLLKMQASKGVMQTTLIQVDKADKKGAGKSAITTQTQQKLKKILAGITVGYKLPGTAEDLEIEMNGVIDVLEFISVLSIKRTENPRRLRHNLPIFSSTLAAHHPDGHVH